MAEDNKFKVSAVQKDVVKSRQPVKNGSYKATQVKRGCGCGRTKKV